MNEVAQPVMAPSKEALSLATSPCSLKRRTSVSRDDFEDVKEPSAKRQRTDYSVTTPPETPAVPSRLDRQEYFSRSPEPQSSPATDRIVDIINQQFGTEILLRHQEYRFINQELAKCQAALEQLRRCHLIPYPATCPTPQQMLDIVDGKVPAVQSKIAGNVPQWAPPFGVVDGPYARHYAKWLIPDPKFDGQIPERQAMSGAPTTVVEGRSMRNSIAEGATIGKRVARGQTGHKPTTGFAAPPPKTKGPCILKRSDGTLVKLVCNGCNPSREDFSSTQGFINHCRISHRREFKSHEEAAVHCGQPIEAGEAAKPSSEDKSTEAQANPSASSASSVPSAPSAPRTIGVHPLARADATTEQNAYAKVLERIEASLQLFHQGKLPGVRSIPGASCQTPLATVDSKPSKSFVGSSATPFLSQLLQSRNFSGNLQTHVEDAKAAAEDVDDYVSYDDDSDEGDKLLSPTMDGLVEDKAAPAGARVPAMRIPARALPSDSVTEQRPSSSKGRSPHLSLVSTASTLPAATELTNDEDASSVGDANMMDVDPSPNTATSNNAPSLVSDDGGDDSDDASSSCDASDADTMSDIAEVNIEYAEIQEHIAQHAGSTSSGSRMKKDEPKHVTFVTPVTGKAAARRKPKI